MKMPDIDLKAKPFYLDEEGAAWVRNTLESMTEEEKIEHLFLPAVWDFTEENLNDIFDTLSPAGVMLRPAPAEQTVETINRIRKKCKIPPLISANIEKGGNGIVTEGTDMISPLAVAASGNPENERRLARVCAKEAKAVGANWGFAPIIDIDRNYRNPIMNTRTLGSNPDIVAEYGRIFTQECQKEGVAVSIKHFPGDGCDDRDQHLVTTVNDLSCEEWMETYGECYKECIEAGALTVMAGHIMQPAWQKKLNPDLKDEDLMPASLSPELIGREGLLRRVLGFNGLIVTDATTMAGFMIPMERKKAVPYSIACGADIFLFNRNLKEDLEYMKDGVAKGILSKERLDEAVCRILALKAALKPYQKVEEIQAEDALLVLGCPEHKAWAEEIADQAITLVKEEEGVLPLKPEKKRILFCPLESDEGYKGSAFSAASGVGERFVELLEKEGFCIERFRPSPLFEGATPRCDLVTDGFDYIIYLANYVTKSNQTTVRIEWEQPMGANCPMYLASVPTIFISVENPYHLQDVPRVKTYINTYSSNEAALEALVEKLMGRSRLFHSALVRSGRWTIRKNRDWER